MVTRIAMGKKDKKFRGKTIEELKKMDVREFAKLLKSRERRSIMRNFNILEEFIIRAKKKIEGNKLIKTHQRDLIIVPQLVDFIIGIYNGKEFIQVKIVEEMLGHRFGEFALTRRTVKHGAAGVGATRSSASLSVK